MQLTKRIVISLNVFYKKKSVYKTDSKEKVYTKHN